MKPEELKEERIKLYNAEKCIQRKLEILFIDLCNFPQSEYLLQEKKDLEHIFYELKNGRFIQCK